MERDIKRDISYFLWNSRISRQNKRNKNKENDLIGIMKTIWKIKTENKYPPNEKYVNWPGKIRAV